MKKKMSPRIAGLLTLLWSAVAVSHAFTMAYLQHKSPFESAGLTSGFILVAVVYAYRWGQSVEAAKHSLSEPTA